MESLMTCFYRATGWAGADLDHALQHSANHGRTRSVKALLRAGANLHAMDDGAMRLAAWEGHTDIVRILLEAGANVHAGGDEAIKSAKRLNYTDLEKLLQDWVAREDRLSLSPKP
ncbi:MAG: ankyrin repeat domain-containing protein [Rhizomicrobium sp.]